MSSKFFIKNVEFINVKPRKMSRMCKVGYDCKTIYDK